MVRKVAGYWFNRKTMKTIESVSKLSTERLSESERNYRALISGHSR